MLKRVRYLIALILVSALSLIILIPFISSETLGKYLSNIEFSMMFASGEVYDLYYEIVFLDEDGNEIKADTIRSIEDDNLPAGQKKVVDGNSLNSIFGSGRLQKIFNNSFLCTVTIDGRYTAEVYIAEFDRLEEYTTGAVEFKKSTGVNDAGINGKYTDPDTKETTYWPLGAEPVYTTDDNQPSGTANAKLGPTSLNFNYTGFHNDVHENWCVRVVLSTVTKVPTFDIRPFLHTTNGSGRGSVGKDEGEDYMSGNLNSGNVWDWNKTVYYNEAVEMDMAADGTYEYLFTFQTNTGDIYVLDSLEINGQAVDVPFAPNRHIVNGQFTDNVGADYIKKTVLSDGTNVTVKMIRSFNGNTQNVYSIAISNTRSNVTITRGNLFQSQGGAAEFIVYSLLGVENNEIFINGEAQAQAKCVVLENGLVFDTIEFRLKDYYEDPQVKFVDVKGQPLGNPPTVTRLDDGTYQISDIPLSAIRSIKLGLLKIEATPMKFALRYDKGDIDPDNVELPNLPEWYDNNGGNYYTVENTSVITIFDQRPRDITNEKTFRYWTVGEGANRQEIKIDQVFSFADLLHYAEAETIEENGEEVKIYVITLTAYWEVWTAQQSWQDAYVENCEEWSSMSWDEWYRECWEKWAPASWRE